MIAAEFARHRLDFVVSRTLGVSRAYAQKLIKSGNVARDDAAGEPSLPFQKNVKPSLIVNEGEGFSVFVPDPRELDLEPEPVGFGVVYEDDDLLVIDKPAGLVVHPAPGHWTGTLVHGLLHRYRGKLSHDFGNMNGVLRPGIVHRLDATTSGLMVVARNGLAWADLAKQFKERTVRKEYLALAWRSARATSRPDAGRIELPIGRDPWHRLRMAVCEDGRAAVTEYRALRRYEKTTLFACRILTGRTHQIRVHMAAIGFPLVGDALYAPSYPDFLGESGGSGGRVFLHSWRLEFTHPRTREAMRFRRRLPAELTAPLRALAGLRPGPRGSI